MYAVFKVQCWLTFYQPSERKITFSLRSLVKPASISSGYPVFLFLIWRPPALPHRLQCSTIGRLGLNRRVRDGNGCVPQPHRHQKSRVLNEHKPQSQCEFSTNFVPRNLMRGHDSVIEFSNSEPLRLRLISVWSLDNSTVKHILFLYFFLRKEVIQPHLPIRLPCYDFTPVIGPAFGSSSLSVRSLTSGVTDSHGVTGGVYKTRERIHRGILIRDY